MIKKNCTILMTGGTGFLGYHIVKRLAQNNVRLILLNRKGANTDRLIQISQKMSFCEMEDYSNLQGVFQCESPDLVIHCATSYEQNLSVVNANLIMPLQLLQCCLQMSKKPIFINAGTILNEQINQYAASKRQFVNWLDLATKEMLCFNIKMDHFYGPFDTQSKFYIKVIQNLLNKAYAINFTFGEQVRDFVYIDDMVEAWMLIIDYALSVRNKKTNGLYDFEVATGKGIAIKDFFRLLAKLVGNDTTQLNFGVLPYRNNELMEYNFNLQPILSLNWVPKYGLDEGLLKTIAFERERILKRE